MPTRSVLAGLLLVALATAACKKDGAKPGPTPTDAAAVAVARPADAAPVAAPPPADAAAATPAGAGADAGAAAAGGDEKKPTNLKVLPKTMTMKQVTAEMKKISKDLGVKCEFCHVKDDFAADDNEHKAEGREMILMTRDLNKQFFKGKNEVTCFTCHKGKEEPAD